MKNSRQIKPAYWLPILLFVLLITAPFLGTFFKWDFYPPQAENRPMAKKPVFRELPFAQWPEKITAWFEDHFGFRSTFIRRYNGISRDWFARQPSSVIVTAKGWLFTTSEGVMSDFMGLRVLSKDELNRKYESLAGRQCWLQQKGIGYLWVVPPNKSVVYPEELTPELQAARGTDGVAQMMNFFDRTNSILHRLDLRSTLLEHKTDGVLYFSNDTHWDPLGSYFGYRAVIDALRSQMPNIGDPVPLADCRTSPARWTGDLIPFVGDGKNRDIDYMEIDPPQELLSGLETVPADELPDRPKSIVEMLIVRNPARTGRVVVFHDSFAKQGWKKFLPLHFNETVFLLAARPDKALWDYAIETFHPDLIIEEQVHRMVLHKQQPEDPAWTAAFKNAQSAK